MKIDKVLRIIGIVLLAFLTISCTLFGIAYLTQGDTKLGVVMLLITLQSVFGILMTVSSLRKY